MNHRDRLEAPFVQVVTMSALAGRAAAATEGACHNFTINWISMLLTQPQFSTASSRMQELSKRHGAGDVMLQKAYGAFFDEMKADNVGTSALLGRADELGYLLRGLKSKIVMDFNWFNSVRVRRAVKKARPRPKDSGVGLVYSFQFNGAVVGAGGGAHTIGFFRKCSYRDSDSAGSILAFDPNFGEYYMFPDEFRGWFRDLRRQYGPFTTDYMKEADRR
jgi:hypothetical protein